MIKNPIMKKSVLKEVIQNIVANKLAEARGEPAKYGYVVSGKGTDDPVIQLLGHSNMPANAWKNKIERDVKDLLARVQREDWRGAAYYFKQHSVLSNAVNMMEEIYTDNKLKEADVGSTDSAAAANPSLNSSSPTDRNKLELDKYQKQLDKVTNDIKEAESNIAKRMDSVNKANKQDELRKQQLTKHQGPLIKKIGQLKKKVAAATPTDTQQL